MTSFRGQASWANMTSPGGKLTALACHLARKANKAEELTYLSTSIGTSQIKKKLYTFNLHLYSGWRSGSYSNRSLVFFTVYINRTAHIRHLCWKITVLSCHRSLMKAGVEKNEQHLNIDYSFDH
jgi:hypothetical protein